ncbi:hypothetical protein BB559_003783 [Furculomyces boomerangus]|uniref:Protein transport protein SFT2 n=1 Tax=Furculomyces boomerangus TaxID=61424 RepID=A0A2T9YIQ4_9FUNG|nr:hypothetical protein BB559_003783 [Furculomyces boomerangus]
MSLLEGLGKLKTSNTSTLPGFGSNTANSSSNGFFSSISEGAASVASNARSRVENFSLFESSNPSETTQRPEWFGLTTFQRWIGAIGFGLVAAFCFMMSLMALPFIVLNPSKFATSFSLGSLMTIFSIALLNGPRAHANHMVSKERIIFTTGYLGTLLLTLWFSIVSGSYIFTILFSIAQVFALVKYVVSYFPGGTSGMSSVASNASHVRSFLPF